MINKLRISVYALIGQALGLLFLLAMVYLVITSWQDISLVFPVVAVFFLIVLSAMVLQRKKPVYSMITIFVLFVLLLGTSVQMGLTFRSVIMPAYFFVIEILYLTDYFFYQKTN